jgi:hypothetical protein
VAVPYADYGILSPLVTIPIPCWHRSAVILQENCLQIFLRFIDSQFVQFSFKKYFSLLENSPLLVQSFV